MHPTIGPRQCLPTLVKGVIPEFGPLIVGQGNSDFVPEYWHRHQQIRRWRLLAGEGGLEDPLECEPTNRFHVSGAELLRLACGKPARFPEPTVSAFADWIYSLYAAEPSKKDLERGRQAEAGIQHTRLERRLKIDSMSNVPLSDWTLEHNGLVRFMAPNTFDASHEHSSYEIPSLRVGSQPLRASPDLLFRHRETRDTVLVEIKFSNKVIPSNLWPNVWAQLWAYAQIPQLQDSPTIRVVGEVWGEVVDIRTYVCLRRVVVHNPRDTKFHAFFGRLFDIYSGASTNVLS